MSKDRFKLCPPELLLIAIGGVMSGAWELVHSPLYADHENGWG